MLADIQRMMLIIPTLTSDDAEDPSGKSEVNSEPVKFGLQFGSHHRAGCLFDYSTRQGVCMYWNVTSIAILTIPSHVPSAASAKPPADQPCLQQRGLLRNMVVIMCETHDACCTYPYGVTEQQLCPTPSLAPMPQAVAAVDAPRGSSFQSVCTSNTLFLPPLLPPSQ